MNIGTGVIIGMLTATVAGSIAQKVMIRVGKVDEAQYLDLAVTCGIGGTAIGFVVAFVKVLSNLK